MPRHGRCGMMRGVIACRTDDGSPIGSIERRLRRAGTDYGSEGWGFKSSRARQLIVFAVGLLLLAGPASAAKRTADLFWTHPDFARAGIQSIAMLPVASYDHNA